MAVLLSLVSLLAATPDRPMLVPVVTAPLEVRGSHFAPRERVRVRVTVGDEHYSRRARAGRGGSFTIAFADVDGCDGVTGVATGSRGSHASFQFSSFLC